MQVNEAVNRAVEWAIKEDLLDVFQIKLMSFYVFLPAKNASLREQVKTLRASDSLRQEEILANSLTECDAEEAYRDIRNDGYEEGLVQGASQKAMEAAENLLREGISIETISKCIGLPMEQLQEIYESNINN